MLSMSSSLSEQGLLSDEIAGIMQAIERRYAPWILILRSVNERAVKAQYEAKIPRE